MHQFIHKFCVTLSNLYWNVYHGFLVFCFILFSVCVCGKKKVTPDLIVYLLLIVLKQLTLNLIYAMNSITMT